MVSVAIRDEGTVAQGTASSSYHAGKPKVIQVPFLESFEHAALKIRLWGSVYHAHVTMWRLTKCFTFRCLSKTQGKQLGLVNRTSYLRSLIHMSLNVLNPSFVTHEL